MTRFRGPKSYGDYAAFEREELRPMYKVGFCVDDLEAEAHFQVGQEQENDGDPEELDFG